MAGKIPAKGRHSGWLSSSVFALSFGVQPVGLVISHAINHLAIIAPTAPPPRPAAFVIMALPNVPT